MNNEINDASTASVLLKQNFEENKLNDLPFRMGEKVIAKHRNGNFCEAQIVAVNRTTGCFDVSFDDGSEIYDLSPGFIQKASSSTESARSSPKRSSSAILRPGDQVEALRNQTDWRFAVVAKVNPDGTFDVIYSDRHRETNVSAEFVRSLYSKDIDDDNNSSPLTLTNTETGSQLQESNITTQQVLDRAAPTVQDYYVGMSIEARFGGGQMYYPAVITGISEDRKLFHLSFEDGDQEENVSIDFIRPPGLIEPATTSAAKAAAAALSDYNSNHNTSSHPYNANEAEEEVDYSESPYQLGSTVEGNFNGRNLWYPGVVMRVHRSSDGQFRFNLKYNDGDTELNVPADRIRQPKLRQSSMRQSNQVANQASEQRQDELISQSKSISHSGGGGLDAKLSSSSSLPTNTSEMHEVKKSSRPLSGSSLAKESPLRTNRRFVETSSATAPSKMATPPMNRPTNESAGKDNNHTTTLSKEEEEALQNISIEANYQGKGSWFPGKIVCERQDGSVDVRYDDGDFEASVPIDRIRLTNKGLATANEITSTLALKVGDRVNANFKNEGQFYPGVIKNVSKNGQRFDIHYDDGDFECNVELSRVKKLASSAGKSKASAKEGTPAATTAVATGIKPKRSTSPIGKEGIELAPGALVEVFSSSDAKWHMARVQSVDEEIGLVDVRYMSGEVEMELSVDRIRLPKASSSFNLSNSSTDRSLISLSSQDVDALKLLLQQKDREISKLRSSTASSVDSVSLNPQDIEALRSLMQQKDKEIERLRSASAVDPSIIPLKPNDITALRTLLQQKDLEIERLKSNQGVSKIELNGKKASKSSSIAFENDFDESTQDQILRELCDLRAANDELKRTVAFLGQNFSVVVQELSAAKQREEKIVLQLRKQGDIIKALAAGR